MVLIGYMDTPFIFFKDDLYHWYNIYIYNQWYLSIRNILSQKSDQLLKIR